MLEKETFPMSGVDHLKPISYGIYRYFWAFVTGWTLVVIALLLHDIMDRMEKTNEMARREALIHLDKDIATRLWAAFHGGDDQI